MSEPTRPNPPVQPALALVLTLAGFFALVVAAFGIVSLAADVEVVPVAGVGQAPGIVAIAAASAAYAAGAWSAVRVHRPTYPAAIPVAFVTWFVYGATAGIAGAVTSGDVVVGAALAGALLVGWPGLVVLLAAAVAGWCAVALVRTRSGRPRWPWEGSNEP